MYHGFSFNSCNLTLKSLSSDNGLEFLVTEFAKCVSASNSIFLITFLSYNRFPDHGRNAGSVLTDIASVCVCAVQTKKEVERTVEKLITLFFSGTFNPKLITDQFYESLKFLVDAIHY